MAPPPLGLYKSLRWAAVRRVLTTADLRPREILEIGCGQGALGSQLARIGNYLGIEPDPMSCAIAGRRLSTIPNAEVRNATFESLHEDKRFDLVCAFEVLEHLEDDDDAIARWTALLAEEGLLLITVPGHPERFNAYDHLGHYRRYDSGTLEKLLLSQGLTEVGVTPYGVLLGDIVEFSTKKIAERRLRKGTTPQSVQEKTAASGRVLVLPDSLQRVATLAAAPFQLLQQLSPGRGPGLIAFGRRRASTQG